MSTNVRWARENRRSASSMGHAHSSPLLSSEEHGAINDDPIAGLKSADDGHTIIDAYARRDPATFKLAWAPFQKHDRSTVLLDDRSAGDHRRAAARPSVADAPVHFGPKPALGIGELDVHLQRACLRIEDVADPGHPAGERFIGESDKIDRDSLTDANEPEERFGDLGGDPHGAQVCDGQERCRGVRMERNRRAIFTWRKIHL